MSINPQVMAYVIDPLERAGRTFVQQFTVLLLAGGSASLLLTQNWLLAVDSAGFAAIVSLLTSILTFKVPTLSVGTDLVFRVVKTGLQSFVGTLTATNVLSVAHTDWKGALAVAVPVALTALLTSLAALALPGTNGASLLPAGTTKAVDDTHVPGEVDYEAESLRRPADAAAPGTS